jgi:hypothetical protein
MEVSSTSGDAEGGTLGGEVGAPPGPPWKLV